MKYQFGKIKIICAQGNEVISLENKLEIRLSTEFDEADIENIHLKAFGEKHTDPSVIFLPQLCENAQLGAVSCQPSRWPLRRPV